jgi:hypothetical protein
MGMAHTPGVASEYEWAAIARLPDSRSSRDRLAVDAPSPSPMPESDETEGVQCVQQERLFAELKHTLGSLVEMQSLQMAALALGDQKVSRFEEEIRVALWAWRHARNDLI